MFEDLRKNIHIFDEYQVKKTNSGVQSWNSTFHLIWRASHSTSICQLITAVRSYRNFLQWKYLDFSWKLEPVNQKEVDKHQSLIWAVTT